MILTNKSKTKAKNKGRRLLAVVSAAVVSMALLTGCRSTKDKEAELSYRQKGISAMALGKYEDAVDYFQKALDQSLGGVKDLEVDICLYKAEALYLMGREDEAKELYTALIEYNHMAEAYYLRGNILFSQGDKDAGLKDFDEALARDDDEFSLYIGIYETLAKYGMSEEARSYLEKALSIKGQSASDLTQKGRIQYYLGDYQTAMELLSQALEKGSKEANLYLTQVYTAVGDNEEADKYFAAYIGSDAADAHTLMVLGENRLNAGNYKSALKFLKGALELGTINEADQQQLMRDTIIAYEYNGNFESAYRLAEEYTKSYPSDFEADKELTFLKTRCKVQEEDTDNTEGE